MNLAKKLKEVTSKFIEIEQTGPQKPESEIGKNGTLMYGNVPSSLPMAEGQEGESGYFGAGRPGTEEQTLSALLAHTVLQETIDLEKVLREANLPQVPITAEQALRVLSALPYDLPQHLKQATVKATLEAFDRERGIHPQEIMTDALLKKAALLEYEITFEELVDNFLRDTDREIARLRESIARLEQLKTTAEKKRSSVEHAVAERVSEFQQLIVFFQDERSNVPGTTSQPAMFTEDDEDEVPSFMREDSVRKILGLKEESADSLSAVGSTEESVSPNRKRLRGQATKPSSNNGTES